MPVEGSGVGRGEPQSQHPWRMGTGCRGLVPMGWTTMRPVRAVTTEGLLHDERTPDHADEGLFFF